jgi:hypothetical protein
VNGLPLDLTGGALSGLNVGNCEHGCAARPKPCGPGTCLPRLTTFTCACPPGWAGPACQTEEGPLSAGDKASGEIGEKIVNNQSAAPTTPAFNGDSFLFFNNEEIHQK